MDKTRDIEMEDVHVDNKEKAQETKEGKLETRLVETRSYQLGLQVSLEDPSLVVASSW